LGYLKYINNYVITAYMSAYVKFATKYVITASLSVLCLLITRRERDKKYENLIYWGKTRLGFSTLPHTPWLREGTEMSRDWEGGLKKGVEGGK
jgi:hypothetical protein